MKDRKLLAACIFYFATLAGHAQTDLQKYRLPGKGLNQHPFLYVGEWDFRNPQSQKMTIVRKGKVVWQYSIPMRTATGGIQEFDDATLLPNGNIVYACMSGAGIITPEKNIIWQYICAKGTETHSCQPIGKDSVLLVVNDSTQPRVLIINTDKNEILKEIAIPTKATNTHGQFRHVRMTKEKTIMVGLFAEEKVVEFNLEGQEIWSTPAKSAWSVIKLHSGNVLISGDGQSYTREINRKGETVWEFTQKDAPFKLYNNQTANRLANGNTVISNWVAGSNNTDEWKSSVQIFEVTPDKKIVWALSSWNRPDLGPSTYIQLLDEPGNPEKMELQR
ncbi:MAG: hypothetical protein ABIS36_07020 [Chryseolinea sp.]